MAPGRRHWVCAALVAVAFGWFIELPALVDAAPPTPEAAEPSEEAFFPFDGYPPNDLCLICHGQPGLTVELAEGQERFIAGVDPQAFAASAHRGLSCAACHPTQSVLPHPEFRHQGQQATAAMAGCSACHCDAYEGYLHGAHGTMVKLEDVRAPTCSDCHGAHDVQPVQEWTNQERAQACARCHAGATVAFADTPSHQAPSPQYLPSAYFAGRFLIILTAAVLAFGIIHVELDMLRWFVRWWGTLRRRARDDGAHPEPPSTRDSRS